MPVLHKQIITLHSTHHVQVSANFESFPGPSLEASNPTQSPLETRQEDGTRSPEAQEAAGCAHEQSVEFRLPMSMGIVLRPDWPKQPCVAPLFSPITQRAHTILLLTDNAT